MTRREPLAHVVSALSMVIFGSSVVATRAVVSDVPPLVLAVLRFGIAGLLLALALAAISRRRLRVSSRDVLKLLSVGVVMFGAFALLFNAGLSLAPASRGALMLTTAPLWTAVLGRMLGTERLTRRRIAGFGLALAGVALVLSGQGLGQATDLDQLAGSLVMLAAAFTGAVGTVLTKRVVATHSPLTVTAYGMLGGALVLLPFACIDLWRGESPSPTWTSAGLIIFLAVAGGALGYSLVAFGLSRLDASAASVYINLNPLTAVLLGAMLLGESIGPAFVAGLVIVILGVLLVNWPSSSLRAVLDREHAAQAGGGGHPAPAPNS